MAVNLDHFELDYKEGKIIVQKHSISGQAIFRVSFPGRTSPLVLTRTLNPDKVKFWTSVPEGRQKEAEEIGPLIERYFRANK